MVLLKQHLALLAWAAGVVSTATAAEDPIRERRPDACGDAAWQLANAPAGSKVDASFSEAWEADLQRIVACLERPAKARACVAVQGRYDATPFEGSVSKALGGETPAQLLRARGRALRVLSRLHDLGVAPNRLLERPPPTGPSFRGVHLELLADCLPAPPEPVVIAPLAPDAGQIRVVVDEAMAERGVGSPTVVKVAMPSAADAPGPWWFSAGGAAVGLLADGVDTGFVGEARVGFGWTGPQTYGRIDTGLAIGSPVGQSRGLASGLGAGLHLLEWLELGVRVGHRISGEDFTAPWTDQLWYGAVESSQCFDLNETGLLFCLEEFVGGGQWSQRAVEVQDTVYFVPEEDRGAFVLGGLITMRQGL